jgi:hypothetical protein
MNCTLSRSTTSPCRKSSSIIKITDVAYAWRFKKIFTFITCAHLQYLISINWTWTPGSPNLRFICPAFSLHMVCDTSVIDSRIMMFCWLASEVFILFWEFFYSLNPYVALYMFWFDILSFIACRICNKWYQSLCLRYRFLITWHHRCSSIYRCWITTQDLQCGKSIYRLFLHTPIWMMCRKDSTRDRKIGPKRRSARTLRLCQCFIFVYL